MDISNIPNEYAVELTPPDITAYAKGNTGVPYFWSFDSGNPGPHALITAIVHGNEPCGAIALDQLLSAEIRPLVGKLTIGFMNVAAYEAFDPDNPNASRWVEEDMNRVWSHKVLSGTRNSLELRRAREVLPLLKDVNFLLDIHSMQHIAPPLLMSGRHHKGRALAQKIGTPDKVVADMGHASGRRLRDFGQFDDPQHPAASVLIECGQHWEKDAAQLASRSVDQFLITLGMAEKPSLSNVSQKSMTQSHYEVVEAVTIETSQFTFAQTYIGGEVIAKKGSLIGMDGDRAIVTPCDNCMLVMPSKRLEQGQTAVRFAQELSMVGNPE